MRFVSPLLKHVLYPCLARAGYLHGAGRQLDLCVLTYHGVLPEGYRSQNVDLDGALITASAFSRQLRLLKSRYSVISPEQFRLWCETRDPLPPHSILLTCDDGLLNNVTEMLPILQAEELRCLFFVTGASLADTPRMLWYEQLYLMLHASKLSDPIADFESASPVPRSTRQQDKRALWWSMVKSLSQFDAAARDEFLDRARTRLRLPEDWNRRYFDDPLQRRRYMTLRLSEVRQLTAAGMSIGSHTVNHPMLSQLAPQSAWREIDESRRLLEHGLKSPVWAMAYPFGDAGSVSHREFAMAERSRYKCAFVNIEAEAAGASSLFALPRVHVTADMSLAELEAHVSGFHQALRQRFAASRFRAVASES